MADNSVKSKLIPQYKKNASIVKILGACIFVCLVFCAGFWARGNESLMTLLGISDPVSQTSNASNLGNSTYNSLSSRVAEVEKILEQDSLDDYDLGTATQLVLNSYISSADDSYLYYYDSDAYNEYVASATTPESGVGILFGEKDGTSYAVDVFDGSQAAALGVQTGDYVDAINGVHQDVWTMTDVINAINRESDSIVITWRRTTQTANDTTNTQTFSTTLDITNTSKDNITYEIVDDVAFIDVNQISLDSAKILRETIVQSLAQGAEAFVIDLRDVPGGYLTQAVDMASFFIQSGTVVQIQTNTSTTARTADGETLTNYPVVIIINENTSGAAEVFAAALQETDRATVVGVVSQGKGSVQVTQPLTFGGALRYTAAVYLTPNGRSLDGSGVSPDITVRDTSDQTTTAIEIARSKTN